MMFGRWFSPVAAPVDQTHPKTQLTIVSDTAGDFQGFMALIRRLGRIGMATFIMVPSCPAVKVRGIAAKVGRDDPRRRGDDLLS